MKRAAFVLVLCMLVCAALDAGAANAYLIEDSSTRPLTEQELREWQYEALDYVLHEIYARHGYHFTSGSDLALYFVQQDWYIERPLNISNEEILEGELSEIEKQNEELIKRVQEDMLQSGMLNEGGRGLLPDVYAVAANRTAQPTQPARTAQPTQPTQTAQPAQSAQPVQTAQPVQSAQTEQTVQPEEETARRQGCMLTFTQMDVEAYRTLKVYSGPGTKYYRGANGKATVSVNGAIYIAGREGDWVLVQYDTNEGYTRVGYITAEYIDNLRELDIQELEFEYFEATVLSDYELTDDPKVYERVIGHVREGTTVTYLAGFQTANVNWAYIETTVDNKKVRGFIPAELLRASN